MAVMILLALIALPFVEIAVLIKVGSTIGVLPTLGLLILGAVAGMALLRRQGLVQLLQARGALERHEAPLVTLIDQMWISLAGLLLIVPGFVTDAVAGLLLIRPVRRYLLRLFLGGAQTRVWVQEEGGPENRGFHGEGRPGVILDGEFHEVHEDAPGLPRREGNKPGEDTKRR